MIPLLLIVFVASQSLSRSLKPGSMEVRDGEEFYSLIAEQIVGMKEEIKNLSMEMERNRERRTLVASILKSKKDENETQTQSSLLDKTTPVPVTDKEDSFR